MGSRISNVGKSFFLPLLSWTIAVFYCKGLMFLFSGGKQCNICFLFFFFYPFKSVSLQVQLPFPKIEWVSDLTEKICHIHFLVFCLTVLIVVKIKIIQDIRPG